MSGGQCGGSEEELIVAIRDSMLKGSIKQQRSGPLILFLRSAERSGEKTDNVDARE